MTNKGLISTALLFMFAALGARDAGANGITLINESVDADGTQFLWEYTGTLAAGSYLTAGDFFTIFDFAGLRLLPDPPFPNVGVWNFSWSNAGPCQVEDTFVCAFGDDPTIPNITWTYTGSLVLGSATTTTPLPLFRADSIFGAGVGDPDHDGDFFDAQSHGQVSSGQYFLQGNHGGVFVPEGVEAVPEGGAAFDYFLLGTGLVTVARRRFTRRR